VTLFDWHAALMAAGWVMAVAAVLVAATQRQRRWWLRLHRAAGLSGAVVILAGAWAAVAAVALSSGEHFGSPHTWLGALTVALAVATPLLGLLQFKIRERAGSFRAYHRLGGRIMAGVALITLLLGLRLAGFL
jgi:uncharacterized iron-regulated membrane protein